MNTHAYVLFNKFLDDESKELAGVNFIRYLSVDPGKKCSIVCQYVNENSNEYYYGLHPRLSPDFLLPLIQEGRLRNQETLSELINEYISYFSLHNGQEHYKEAVFAKVILRMASRFGIIIQGSKEHADKLIHYMKKNDKIFMENITYKYLRDDQIKNTVDIAFLGGLIDEAAEYLDKSDFAIKADNDLKLLKLLPKGVEGTSLFKNLYNLIKDWKTTDVFRLCHGAVYYSGVLPRVVRLEKIDSYSNPDIQTIKLYVEKTTFATVDAFDYCDIIKHPLLKPYFDLLVRFERNEDEAQKILFSNEVYLNNEKMISAINQYLSKSYNTHTIAVSGNVITKDNALLVAIRHKDVIDSGTYYCSVNGQSEFRDNHVSFYMESVYEDYPTLVAEPNVRNDFGDELNREAVAELNIHLKGAWQYYGLAILGIQNKDGKPTNTRRMHFNVLAYNSADEYLQDIITLRTGATERYENLVIKGIKMHLFYNRMDKIKTFGAETIAFFNEYGSIIGYALGFLFLFLTGLNFNMKSQNLIEVANSISTYTLALFALLHGVLKLIKQLRERILIKPYLSVYRYTAKNNTIENVELLSRRILNNIHFHPILLLMLSLNLYHMFEKKSRS